MSELTRLLRESSRDCSGREPSLSMLQIAAELGADILDSPTEEMLGAGRMEVVAQTGWTLTDAGLAKIWKAMLAAAPNPLDTIRTVSGPTIGFLDSPEMPI